MYSNPKNKPEDRVEFLEHELELIQKGLTHLGAQEYKNEIPFYQWVVRESNALEYRKRDLEFKKKK